MKKRLIALLLVLALLVPASFAAAETWYRVNTSSLRVHYMAGENSRVLASYRRDYALTVESRSNGWAYVKFSNGFKGYVQSSYISRASSYRAWIYGDNTKLRRGPDGGFAAVASLAKGTQVSVLSAGTNYSYVKAGSHYGYVVNKLLSKKRIKASGTQNEYYDAVNANYNAWIMNTAKVNLRKSPSTSAAVIAQYDPGTQVYVEVRYNDWSRIVVGGNTGWMMSRFLSTSRPAEIAGPPAPDDTGDGTYTAYVVTDNKKSVNVRKGPGLSYTKLFGVSYGMDVTVLKHESTWDYIRYNGRTGYVMNKYLQLSRPADADDYTPAPAPEPTPNPAGRILTVTSPDGKSVNFHRGPGLGYSDVNGCSHLKVGSQVTLIEISSNGKWYKVEYEGFTGWIMNKYVR